MKFQIFRFVGLICIFISWFMISLPSLNSTTDFLIIIVGPIISCIISVIGRLWIETHKNNITQTNIVIHYAIMLFLGFSIVRAILSSEIWFWKINLVPDIVIIPLMIISLIFLFITVVNLAVKGLGAPFAFVLSKKLASEWLYRKTRNPMVLAMFSTLLSIGIFYNSWVFIFWVILEVIPFFIIFLKLYEEKELEIRFGSDYLKYKNGTPFLFPKIFN